MPKLTIDQIAAQSTPLSNSELRAHRGGMPGCWDTCQSLFHFCLVNTPEEICFARLDACESRCVP